MGASTCGGVEGRAARQPDARTGGVHSGRRAEQGAQCKHNRGRTSTRPAPTAPHRTLGSKRRGPEAGPALGGGGWGRGGEPAKVCARVGQPPDHPPTRALPPHHTTHLEQLEEGGDRHLERVGPPPLCGGIQLGTSRVARGGSVGGKRLLCETGGTCACWAGRPMLHGLPGPASRASEGKGPLRAQARGGGGRGEGLEEG